MPYIGKNLVGILKDARASDTMTGDGSDTTLTLTDTPGSTNNVLVFLDGIRQTPVTDYWVTGRNLTFTTAPEAGVLVVALTGSASSIDPKMGSVTSSKIVDGMVGNAKSVALSASKLTGALPAISGAALTNFVSSTGIDNVNSEPTISTNPAGGVGTIQLNQVSGEMYVCTDATAGSNVWINVGGGEGNIFPFSFGGTIKGFSMGCESGSSELDTIEHYSYSSDGDATDVANLTFGVEGGAGGKSKSHAYQVGGKFGRGTVINTIQKFSFSSIANSTNVATLKEQRKECAGACSETHIFVTGGKSSQVGSDALADDIQKIATASDANGVRTGDLTNFHTQGTSHTCGTHGYAAGGYTTASSSAVTNVIERYSLSSDENASDVGDMTVTRRACNGMSSSTYGYTSGGSPSGGNVIDKYQFSASANATDVGDLTVSQDKSGSSSSTTNGYSADGGNSGGGSNQIEKISFSTNANATDIGNLTNSGGNRAGTQH